MTHPALSLVPPAYLQELQNKEAKVQIAIDHRRTWEQNIAGELIELIQKDPESERYQRILNLSVKNDKGENQKSLLIAICMQIAESWAEYKDKPEDLPAGLINWGSQRYTFEKEEYEKFGYDAFVLAVKDTSDYLYKKLTVTIKVYEPVAYIHVLTFPGDSVQK